MPQPTIRRSLVGLVAVLALGACDAVLPSNPYDPATSPAQQAKAKIDGTIVLRDPFSADIRRAQLDAITIAVVDADGRPVEDETGEAIAADISIDDDVAVGESRGSFTIPALTPGAYQLVVTDLGATYVGSLPPAIVLGPGDEFTVPTLVYVATVVEGDGPGSIAGAITVDGGGGGQHTVSLFTKRGDLVVGAAAQQVTGAAFSFTGLQPGTYAVVVDSPGLAPAWRLDVEIPATTGPGQARTFVGPDAIVLHPVTAVLLPLPAPEVVLDEGQVYVRADDMPLAVLSFGVDDVGVTAMRLSTDPSFGAGGTPLPFVAYQASTAVPLGGREGPITIHAQFEARSPGGFNFTSDIFTLDVIRDVTPPRIDAATVVGGVADGTRLLLADRAMTVDVDVVDDASGVDARGIALGGVVPDAFIDLTAGPGLVRVTEVLVADSDGEDQIAIAFEDRAGNRSPTTVLPVFVDTSAPDGALVVDNAPGGSLSSRIALLDLDNTAAATDPAVAIQVRVVGQTFSEVLPADDGPFPVIVPSTFVDGDRVVFEARLIDQVGNERLVTRDVDLALLGQLVGRVVGEGVPNIVGSVAGASVTVRDSAGTLVDTATLAAAGVFTFNDVGADAGYSVEVALNGFRTTTVAGVIVAEPIADGTQRVTDLETITLPLARGDVVGRARRGDLVGDGTAHAGIAVTARLGGGSRTFIATTATDAAGDFSFSSLPTTINSERYSIEARREDYASAIGSITVVDNARADVGQLVLAPEQGDFDVCRTAGPCVPLAFTNESAVRVRLRDATDAARLLVQVNGAAVQTLTVAADNLTTVSLGGVGDGNVDIAVQIEKTDGSRGGVLSTSVVRDTVPPSDVDVTRVASPRAHDARFTAEQFVDVILEADAGSGSVAPLATPRLVVADVAPSTPPASGVTGCVHGSACRLALPGADVDNVAERVHTIFAFACDVAGNCATPVSTFVIHDTTPPKIEHGVSFAVFADGSVEVDDGGVPVEVLPSPFAVGEINLGAARTAVSIPVTDDTGAAVADVFAFRFSLSEQTIDRAALATFSTPPGAADVRSGADIALPALVPNDSLQTVVARFEDAAGNPSSTFIERVRIDARGPDAVVVLNGGLATNQASVPFTVTVPPGGEAPTIVRFSVDGGGSQVFPLPLVGTERLTLGTSEGARRVIIEAVDLVGNAVRSEQGIVVDRTAPRLDSVVCIAADCVDSGAGTILTRAADGTIDLAASGFDASGIVGLVVTVDGGAPRDVIGTVANDIPVVVDGSALVSVVARDAVGNLGAPFSRAVTHDRTPPAIASVTLEEGAARTRDPQVAVRTVVSAGDAVDLRLSTSTSFAGPVAPFRADESFTLGGADGQKQVCVEVRDAAGNAASACDSIELDRAAPTGTISPAVALTSAATVGVTLTHPADTARVAVSSTALSCAPETTPYQAAAPSPQSLTVTLGAGDGVQTLFACFEDLAGNTAQATTTVTVDRTAPSVGVSLDAGATFTLDEEVGVALTPSETVVSMALAVDVGLVCSTATYVPFVASSTVGLGLAEGTHTVRACVQDAAGNKSAVSTDTIVLDLSPPAGNVVLEGGANFTRDLSVGATITRTTEDATSFAVAVGANLDCATASYSGFQTSSSIQLAAVEGIQTVSVCLKDGAGRTARVTDTITVDRVVPTGTIVVANGSDTTPVREVTATLTFAADVVLVAVSAFPIACDTATFSAPSTSVDVTLPFTGPNTVTACLKDGAGNVAAVQDEVFLEEAAGDSLVIAIDGGSATARDRDVIVSLFRPSSDFTTMKVIEAPTIDCTDLSGYEAFNSTKALTVSSGTAPAEGSRTIAACVRNPGNGLTRAATDSIVVDSFLPAGSVVINDAALVTGSRSVSLDLTNAFATETLTVALAETSTLSGGSCSGSFEAFTAEKTFTLSNLDGSRSVFVCLRDAAGNTTEVQDSIVLDQTPPSPVSLSVPPLTRSTTVTATLLFPTDAVTVALAEGAIDCATAAGYIPVPTSLPPTVTVGIGVGDGPHTILACFRDAAGNTSQTSAITTLDTTPPTASIAIDGGAVFTTDRSVLVSIVAPDAAGVALLEQTGSPDCGAASYEAVTATKVVPLTSPGDGRKTLQVCVQDAAGNQAAGVPASITLDETAPNGTIVVNNGDAASASRSVVLGINAGIHTDVVSFAVAEDTIACNASNLVYSPFSTVAAFLLSSGDEEKTVLLCLKDQAGNVSSVTGSDTIVLDATAPVVGALPVQIVDGDGFLQGETTVSVTLSWTTQNDVATVKAAEGAVDCSSDAGYAAVPTNSTSTTITGVAISAAEGNKLVVACLRDAAGNVTLGQDGTVRDSVAPAVVAVTCLDCVTGGNGTLFSTDATVSVGITGSESVATARVSVDGGADATVAVIDGTVAVGSLADGAHTIRVKLRDAAGNTTADGDAKTLAVTVDGSAPSVGAGAVTLRGLDKNGTSSSLTRTPFITVQVAGAPADTALIRLSEDATFAAGTQAFAPFAASALPFSLSAGDGAKTVAVQLKDAAGNVGAVVTRTISLDTTAPAATSLALAGGATFTNATTVAATLTATGATEMRLGTPDNDVDSEAFVVFATSTTVTIENAANADGPKTVVATFRDDAGNEASAVDVIDLDRTSPIGGAVSINGGAAVTNNTTVTLTLGRGSSDVIEMQVNGGAFVPFSDTVLSAVSSGDCPAGTLCKSIAVVLRDAAGNTETVSDTISLDTAAPSAVSVSLTSPPPTSDNAGFSTTGKVAVSFAFATGAGQATLVKHGEGAIDCGTDSGYVQLGATSPEAVPGTVNLSAGDGQKFYLACFKDAAGNITQASTSVIVDTLDPSGSIQIDSGNGFTTDTSVTVTITPSQDDVVQVFLDDAIPDCTAVDVGDFVTIESTLPFTIGAIPGTAKVEACFRDRAGNVSVDAVNDAIVLDPDAPAVSFSLRSTSAGALAGFTPTSSIELAITSLSSDATEIAVAETTIDCGTASFEALPQPLPSIAASSPLVRPFSVSGTDGSKTVAICVKDAAGLAASATAAITLDGTAPDVTAFINDDDDFTRSSSVLVSLSSFPPGDSLAFAITATPEAGCDRIFPEPIVTAALPASVTATILGPDGTRSLGVCLRDRAGNVALVVDDIELDTAPPVVGSRACDDCNALPSAATGQSFFFTNDTIASLSIDTPSADVVTAYTIVHRTTEPLAADRVCVADSDCRLGRETCEAVPVSTIAGAARANRCVESHDPDAIVVSLAAPGTLIPSVASEGQQAVMIVLEDVAGNMSINQLVAPQFRVIRDVTPPLVTFTTNAGITNQLTVFVRDLVATDNLESVAGVGTFLASGLSTFADTTDLPYSTAGVMSTQAFPVTLAAGDGLKSIFVEVSDHAGNATPVQAAVILDTTKPTTPRFDNAAAIIGDGNDGSDLLTVTIQPLAQESDDINLVTGTPYVIRGLTAVSGCLGLTGGAALATGECTWDGTRTITVTGGNLGEGENRLQVFALDQAGNASDLDTLTILKDTRAPDAPVLLDVNERDGSVTFAWNLDADADVTGYLLFYGEDDGALNSGNFANEGVSPIFIPQQVGTQTVQFTLSGLSNDTPFVFRVRTIDVARNRSATHTPSTVFDAMPNPIAPERQGFVGGPSADSRTFDVEGPRAAVLEDGNLCIYDVADPTTMSRLDCSTSVGAAEGVVMHGRFAYLTGSTLQAVNIANSGALGAPTAIDLGANDAMEHLRFVGRFAVGARDGQIVSLQQPGGSPALTTISVIDSDSADAFPAPDNDVVAFDATSRMAVYVDTSAVRGPQLRAMPFNPVTGALTAKDGSLQLTSVVNDLAVETTGLSNTERAYVCGPDGVQIYRVDASGVTVATFSELGSIGGVICSDVEVIAGTLFVVQQDSQDFTRMFIYDVSDATAPVLTGRVLASRSPEVRAIHVDAGMLYGLATSESNPQAPLPAGLHAFRLTEPERMTVVGRTGSVVNLYTDVVVDGSIGFVGGAGFVDVYRILDPTLPAQIFRHTLIPGVSSDEPSHLDTMGRVAVYASGGNTDGGPSGGRAFFRVDTNGTLDTTFRPVSGGCAGTSAKTTDVVTWGSLVVTTSSSGRVEVWDGRASPAICVGDVTIPLAGGDRLEELSNVVDGAVFVASREGVVRRVTLDGATGAPSLAATPSTTVTAGDGLSFGFGDLENAGSRLYVTRPDPTPSPDQGLFVGLSTTTLLPVTTSIPSSHGAIARIGGEQFVVSNGADARGPDNANGIFGIDFSLGVLPDMVVARNQGVRAPRAAVVAGTTVFSASRGSGIQIISLSR